MKCALLKRKVFTVNQNQKIEAKYLCFVHWIKCEAKFFLLLQFEKRRGQAVVSSFFELEQQQIPKQGNLAIGF